MALGVVLGVPFLFRPASERLGDADRRVIIITPHNEQIRREFASGFADWHEREFGETAEVVWVQPGGTSEIRRQLQATYRNAIKGGQLTVNGELAGGMSPMPQDLLFGGGSYEHGQMKRGVEVALEPDDPRVVAAAAAKLTPMIGEMDTGEVADLLRTLASDAEVGTVSGFAAAELREALSSLADEPADGVIALELAGGSANVTMSISVPFGYSESELEALFGANYIGPRSNPLYEPEQYWLGTATSGFGIVYNRDVLRELEVVLRPDLPADDPKRHEPNDWEDFGHPGLRGWVALADPRQSGSVTTTYDSILNQYGWEKGWRILREMSANARYFANSSPKVPLDVSQGQAAIGVAIDFYGRYQSQAVMQEGETPETSRVGYIDPEGAVFIDPDPITLLRGAGDRETAERFVQFVLSDAGQALWQFPVGQGDEQLGPERFELRRMPVRREFIAENRERFIDKVDPFAVASTIESRGWRSAVAPMMAAFGIETHDELVRAWDALIAARRAHEAGSFPADELARMEELFYSMPVHEMPDGTELVFNPENYRAVRDDWRDPMRWPLTKIAYYKHFRDTYREVVRLWKERGGAVASRES